MDSTLLTTRLHEQFGDRIQRFDTHRSGEVVAYIGADALIDVCTFLRDESDLDFNFLENLCGVDYLGRTPRFEVVYHLLSMKNRSRVCLKVGLDAVNPTAPTLTGMWQTANYQEREAYDMFGITFTGHPSLDRILMPEIGSASRSAKTRRSATKKWRSASTKPKSTPTNRSRRNRRGEV